MSVNLSILALQRAFDVGNSALLTPTLLSSGRSLSFYNLFSKKAFHPFIFSFNSNFNMKIAKSSFAYHLQSPIKLISETYSFLNSQQRITLMRKTNTKLNDCTFKRCSALGKGIDGNGGAIFIFYSLYSMFSLSLERINFVECVAKSSGGCAFVFNTKFESDLICISKSFASQNKLFFIQADEVALNSTHTAENDDLRDLIPSTHSIGISSSLACVREMNTSNTKTDNGACLLAFNRFKYLILQNSVFSNCQGSCGLSFHGLINSSGDLKNCLFEEPNLTTNTFGVVDSSVNFIKCIFLMDPCLFTIERDENLILLSSSFFKGAEKDWETNCSFLRVTNPEYGIQIPKASYSDFPDASLLCRVHEKSFKLAKDNDRTLISMVEILNITMTYLPIFTGFIACITCFMYSRKKPKEDQIPNALLEVKPV